jgi:hypothetical protein
MKKNKPTAFITMLVLAWTALALACGSGPSPGGALPETPSTVPPPGFRLRSLNTAAPLSAKSVKGNPRINIILSLLEVQEPGKEAQFFYDLLYSGSGPEQYRDALVKEYQDLYQEDPPDGEAGRSFQWEHRETINARSLRERGLALAREKYIFTGGAHGMGTTTYYVADRGSLKILTMTDFFAEPGGEKLRSLIKEELRRRGGLAKDAPLSAGIYFEDEPPASSNFFINDEGLGLRWDPYEIAPYSEGGIEIILPWKVIRPLLKHEAMELLAEFGIYLFVS